MIIVLTNCFYIILYKTKIMYINLNIVVGFPCALKKK